MFKQQDKLKNVVSNGFFKHHLLSEKKINLLKNIVADFEKNESGISFNGLKYSLFNLSPEYSSNLSRELKKIIFPELSNLFHDFDALLFSYIKKDFSTKNEFEFHQDWNYTNRKKYFTLTGWLALHDIEENNGCLIFTKSHNNFKNIISSSYKTLRFESKKINSSEVIKVPLKKGEIVFFDPQAFHGSLPNNSSMERKVITFIVKPKKAPFLYFHKLNNYIGKAFEINEEFLINDIVKLSNGLAPSKSLSNYYFLYNFKYNQNGVKKQIRLD